MRIKELLFGGSGTGSKWGDLALLLTRANAGFLMVWLHGRAKLPPSGKMIGSIGDLGFPVPVVFAWLAALSEVVGAACIIVGLATRLSATFLSIVMGVAAFVVHRADSLKTKELALVYLGTFLLLAFTGAGRFSADAFLRRK